MKTMTGRHLNERDEASAMTGRNMSAMMDRPTRIALIGNMNNNHFALMRHLRDLGTDAHLFLYSNEHAHFLPQCDTTDWARWRPYVHELGISNGGRDTFYRPIGPIAAKLDGFDAWLGNGIAPVLFARMNRILDVFVPYAEGCEFIIEHEWKWSKPLASAYSAFRSAAMERAIRNNVNVVVTANAHEHSQTNFRRLGKSLTDLYFPMIYQDNVPSDADLTEDLRRIATRMDEADLAIFSHVSHFWKNLPVRHYMGGVGKRNQWLIEGFAQYLAARPDAAPLLVLVEYGPDVAASKQLIEDLGIADHVVWLPLISRVEIMALLRHVDIGGSEFAGMLWGGVGWEFLASGVPMLHMLDDPSQYERADRPLPPFFNVTSPQDIARVLEHNDRASLAEYGSRVTRWYEDHQGSRLAAEYADLLANAAQTRGERAETTPSLQETFDKERKGGQRFGFGENWKSFLALLDERRIVEAERSLERIIGKGNIAGKSFVDLGSGSGLFSLAARRLGAKVHSIDLDPSSVWCTETLRDRFYPGDEDWSVDQGSALDRDALLALGKFEIVYSWGVLHHSGEMWTALKNAFDLVAPGGVFMVAIYNDQGWKSHLWWLVKKLYNILPAPLDKLFAWMSGLTFNLLNILKYTLRAKPMVAIRPITHKKSHRGMDFGHDLIDWYGGLPYECATYEALVNFAEASGLRHVRGERATSLGCHEILFQKPLEAGA